MIDFREQNLNSLVEYFASGCKKEQLLGLELEHFVIDCDTRFSLPYENGAEEILTQLQPIYGKPIFSESGRIIGIENPHAVITLEPAAQLEISIEPMSCTRKIRAVYDEFAEKITPILRAKNCELFCAAYQPASTVDKLPLIPKKRYELMHEYFKNTGTHGAHMMRGTAATQVNIDYESEGDFVRKFTLANSLSAKFSSMYDPTKRRAEIWKNVDPARTVPPKEISFRGYAEYIYDMPPIFILQDGETISTGSKTSSEIFKDRPLTQADIEHITSMAFPDVRLKNRIELRMVDSLPIEKAIEFTEMVAEIFYKKVAK
jgi:glutamate--cysteine ligase